MKTTMTCTGTKFRFGTMETVYREKCGESMNLFQDKSHSDITWVALRPRSNLGRTKLTKVRKRSIVHD